MPKWMVVGAGLLFALIGTLALFKRGSSPPLVKEEGSVSISPEEPLVKTPVVAVPSVSGGRIPILPPPSEGALLRPEVRLVNREKEDFPVIDRISQLFSVGPMKLPIVETVVYSSSVPWLKGRPAWIADYAVHYNTSRHFIARSLNGKADYFTQRVIEGSQFNVFRQDKRIHFYLLVDLSRCKMGFYYVDLDTNQRVLIKTYRVGLGRLDSEKGISVTPVGRYALGDRIAIYKPGTMGFHQDQKVEMIRTFGTRWIPFGAEVDGGTQGGGVRGYGLQGAPWITQSPNGQLIECRETVGAYESDGCIRMLSEDIEELFAIVVTKPTFIEIVTDFREAKLPGIEVATPSRSIN